MKKLLEQLESAFQNGTCSWEMRAIADKANEYAHMLEWLEQDDENAPLDDYDFEQDDTDFVDDYDFEQDDTAVIIPISA